MPICNFRARLDLNLVPFRIELRSLLIFDFHLDLFLFEIKIYKELINHKIWDYSTPVFKGNIFNLNKAEPDRNPPKFSSFEKEVSKMFSLSAKISQHHRYTRSLPLSLCFT